MAHDITVAWNICLESCFTSSLSWHCKTESIEIRLTLYPDPKTGSLSGQVTLDGLPSGVTISVVYLHIPHLGRRFSDFERFIATEELWRTRCFLKREDISVNLHLPTTVVLQIGLANPSRSSALTEHRASMKKLFTQHWQSDWVIRVDQEEIPVHKAIVGAQSPILRDIIDRQQTEDCFIIDDFGADVVRNMLMFLYTGEVQQKTLTKMAYELYKIADKYLINGLKRLCEIELVRQVDDDNVFDILRLATLPSGESLKARLLPSLVKIGSKWDFKKYLIESFTHQNSCVVKEIIQSLEELSLKYQQIGC